MAQWLKPLPVYPAGVWFDPARVHLQFLNSRNVFDWLDPGSIPARVRRKNFRFPASRNPGSNPRHDRVRCLMSLACRLRSERPGFESGFGPTAIQRWRAPSELAQQRRNERRHGTTPTPTDVTDAEERPQLRHCAWSRKNAPANHDQHLSVVTRGTATHAELSRGMGPEAQNAPWRPY